MKFILKIFPIFALLATACSEEARDDALKSSKIKDGYAKVFSDSSITLKDLMSANADLQRGYSKAAAEADRANNIANGGLLLIAIDIALGDVGSTASSVVSRKIVLALGLNEAVKYADPSQVARAFRKASNEAVCLNLEAIRYAESKENNNEKILKASTALKIASKCSR